MEDMTIDEKLAVDKFHVDEGHEHICVDADASPSEIERLVKLCPAGLYRLDGTGRLTFDYAGCLECGTCLVVGLGGVVRSWSYPRGGMGVEFRQG